MRKLTDDLITILTSLSSILIGILGFYSNTLIGIIAFLLFAAGGAILLFYTLAKMVFYKELN